MTWQSRCPARSRRLGFCILRSHSLSVLVRTPTSAHPCSCRMCLIPTSETILGGVRLGRMGSSKAAGTDAIPRRMFAATRTAYLCRLPLRVEHHFPQRFRAQDPVASRANSRFPLPADRPARPLPQLGQAERQAGHPAQLSGHRLAENVTCMPQCAMEIPMLLALVRWLALCFVVVSSNAFAQPSPIGSIDQVIRENGQWSIKGWVCQPNLGSRIGVKVYVSGISMDSGRGTLPFPQNLQCTLCAAQVPHPVSLIASAFRGAASPPANPSASTGSAPGLKQVLPVLTFTDYLPLIPRS